MKVELPLDPTPPAPNEPVPMQPVAPMRVRRRLGLIDFAEWGLALAVTIIALVAHVAFFRNAGGLWRDEVNTVNIATSPTLPEMHKRLEFESYPLLWPIVVRLWHAAGLGESDEGYRRLGLIVGVALLATLWLQALVLSRQPPLFALVAVALLPPILRYGDSLRAYGMSIVLVILTLLAVWRTAERCTFRRWAVAVLAATASVYCLYHNCVLVFVICIAAACGALARRDWRPTCILPTIGLAAAIVLALGQGSRLWQRPDWLDLVMRNTVNEQTLFAKFMETLREGGEKVPIYWGTAAIAALVAAGFCLCSKRLNRRADNRSFVVFLLTGVLIAPICYLLFLLGLRFTTEPWYYILLITFLAICIDQLLTRSVESNSLLRWLRILVLAAMVNTMWEPVWTRTPMRMTNIDLIGGEVNRTIRPGDYVIVSPWWLGVSFHRYYTGPAEWTTVPEIEDQVCHRYDLVKQRMAEPAPLASIFERIDRTLKSGGAVYYVGDVVGWDVNRPLFVLPPAPQGPMGWHEELYLASWSQQSLAYLSAQASSSAPITPASLDNVNSYERMRLVRFQGWQGQDRGAELRKRQTVPGSSEYRQKLPLKIGGRFDTKILCGHGTIARTMSEFDPSPWLGNDLLGSQLSTVTENVAASAISH